MTATPNRESVLQNAPEQPSDFYTLRYSTALNDLHVTVFSEVYDDYFGQSSLMSTADYDRVSGWLEANDTHTVLDVGCGGGAPSLRLAERTGCSVVGVDASPQAIELANNRASASTHRVRFLQHNASIALPFADGTFDGLICLDALAHLRDHQSVFIEWSRVLKRHGYVVFTNNLITGPISNEEVAARTPSGYFEFAIPGSDEHFLGQAGFKLTLTADLTPSLTALALRHCKARERHALELRALEGDAMFEVQNHYRAVMERLVRERRLSHFAYVAQKN